MFIYTLRVFGCQMNYADAERIASRLNLMGGKDSLDIEEANCSELPKLDIFLSCGVREGAEQRIISLIKKTKKDNPHKKIILTGCLGHRKDLRQKLSDVVDLFIRASKFLDYEKEIYKILNKPKKEKESSVRDFYSLKPLCRESFRAVIPIIAGCNNFCSYCVVPYARGREVSRSPEEVFKEVKVALKNGAKEIFLLGQNVNSYKGIDKTGKLWDFPDLLEKISNFRGDFWLKFLSSHPKDVSLKLIRTMKKGKKISANLHLPIQSGSDKILKLMNRKYTVKKYLSLIEKAKRIYPGIIISSDIIVGFPGENKKDFLDSVRVVKKVGYEMLFSLKYSPRPETLASKMKDDVVQDEKKKRQLHLDAEWKKIALKNNQKFIGKKIKFIVNGVRERQNDFLISGKSFEEKTVCITQKKSDNIKTRGDWVWAKINKVSALSLNGEIVTK